VRSGRRLLGPLRTRRRASSWHRRERFRTPRTSPRSADAFARFAEKVAKALGPACRVWTVLNEPLVFVLGGFVDGQIPPGLCDTKAAGAALANLLRAHAFAARAIRNAIPNAAIGVAHNMTAFVPERKRNLLDRFLGRRAHALYNRGLLDAFANGRWNLYLPPFTWLSGRCPEVRGTLDF
jgi:beta-glucosidase